MEENKDIEILDELETTENPKDLIFRRLANLFSVKSIITIAFTIVFTILSIRGTIGIEQFLTMFTTIIAFYFGTQAMKE